VNFATLGLFVLMLCCVLLRNVNCCKLPRKHTSCSFSKIMKLMMCADGLRLVHPSLHSACGGSIRLLVDFLATLAARVSDFVCGMVKSIRRHRQILVDDIRSPTKLDSYDKIKTAAEGRLKGKAVAHQFSVTEEDSHDDKRLKRQAHT